MAQETLNRTESVQIDTTKRLTYTVDETARMCGIGRRTLYDLIERDASPIRFERFGRAIRFPKAAVHAFLFEAEATEPQSA